MSWLSEIAGKAEDLLNKVDKTTAVVLQSKQASPSRKLNQSAYSLRSVDPELSGNSKPYNLSSSFSHVPLRASTVSDRAGWSNSRGYVGNTKRGPVSDDEKLLEYLNSNEPALPELRKKILKKKNQTGSSASLENSDSVAEQMSSTINDTTDSTNADSHPSTVSKEYSSDSKTASNENLCDKTQSGSSPDDNDLEEVEREFLQHQKDFVGAQTDHALQKTDAQYVESAYYDYGASVDDRGIRDFVEREADLVAALDAKDSQLAVLKVRLEEDDQEIINKTDILEELKDENQRLLKDYNDAISNHSQAVGKFRDTLAEYEARLNKTEEDYRATQNEHLEQMSKSDEEKRQLAESITNLQKKINELNERSRESSFHLNSANRNLESLQQEYADYKQRAQRILQMKEKLINSLKEGQHDTSEDTPNNESSYAVLRTETEGIKQERDLFKEELRKAMDSIEMHKNEIHELEKMAQGDSDAAREHCRNLDEQLHQERMLKEEVHRLNTQLKEEIKFLQEEMSRQKNGLNNRIEDRDMEIEKLRKQLMAKSLSTVSQDELESRLHALTENLIQKQTIVEALSTEKNSLMLQLERVEQQLKEAQMYGMQHHHAMIGINSNESDRKQKAPLFLENPFDSNLTRNVKRVYGSIDAFSIRLGVFFRRYPVARLFVFIYMLILHFWVMIVLLTYEPEVHGPMYKPNGN